MIDQGGFGVISKAQVRFTFKDKNEKQKSLNSFPIFSPKTEMLNCYWQVF